MQIQDNQQSLDEQGESHHKFNTCHEHNAYEKRRGWKIQ
jgi:hypothetical protein